MASIEPDLSRLFASLSEGVWQREVRISSETFFSRVPFVLNAEAAQVFAVVDRELDASRKSYADVAARTGAAMRRVTNVQAARVGKILPPGVSPDVLSTQLLAAPDKHAILSEVLAVAPITQALAQVPAMLQFYRELSHLVAHNRLWSKVCVIIILYFLLLSNEQERLRTTHVKDAIVQLAKEMEADPLRAADLLLHFEQFKVACKKMQDAFFVLPNQNGANEVLLGTEIAP